LEYGDVHLSDKIQKNKPFDVRITVKNAAASGAALLKSRQYLLIDGLEQGFKRIALCPGEEKPLVWSGVKIMKSGKHTIQVGDSEKIQIEVLE